jgi:hypothetical protein
MHTAVLFKITTNFKGSYLLLCHSFDEFILHFHITGLFCVLVIYVGRDSAFGISTALRAGRSGDRIPVGARFSAPAQTGRGAHPTFYTMGTGFFPGGKAAGAWLDHPTHIAPMLKKSTAVPLLHLWTFVASSRVNSNLPLSAVGCRSNVLKYP